MGKSLVSCFLLTHSAVSCRKMPSESNVKISRFWGVTVPRPYASIKTHIQNVHPSDVS